MLALATILAAASGCAGKPRSLGLVGEKLTPCPETPNCVSSQAEDPDKRMEPIPFAGEHKVALARLLTIVRERPRAKITRNVALEGSELSYVSAEFSSFLFGFVDDVEFVVDGGAKLIHFRSASRMGYSDLGVNRGRMEEISKEFSKRP